MILLLLCASFGASGNTHTPHIALVPVPGSANLNPFPWCMEDGASRQRPPRDLPALRRPLQDVDFHLRPEPGFFNTMVPYEASSPPLHRLVATCDSLPYVPIWDFLTGDLVGQLPLARRTNNHAENTPSVAAFQVCHAGCMLDS
jgi:hypothetical protein